MRVLRVFTAMIAVTVGLLSTGVGAAQESHAPMELEKRGCCSHHKGVCGCSQGTAMCCDGSASPTCGC